MDVFLFGNQCVFCNKKLRNWSILIRYVDFYVGKRCRCRICNEVCNKIVDFQVYIKIYRSEKKSLLNGVAFLKYFKGFFEIFFEIKIRRNGSGEIVMNKICSFCQVEFSLYFNLKRYMKCYNSLKMFKCYVCFVNFRTKQELFFYVVFYQVLL